MQYERHENSYWGFFQFLANTKYNSELNHYKNAGIALMKHIS